MVIFSFSSFSLKARVDLDFLTPGKKGALISITGSVPDKICSELSHSEISIT